MINKSILAVVSLILVTTLLTGLFISYTILTRSNYILSGVSFNGTPLGNQTRSEAWNVLRSQHQEGSVNLMANDRVVVSPSITELGINLDIQKVVNAAYQVGRESHPLFGMFQMLAIDRDLPPTYQVDWGATENYLNGVAPQLIIEPQDAQLAFENGQYVATGAKDGQALNIPDTISRWQQAFASDLIEFGGALPLVMMNTAPATSDMAAYVAEANQLLGQVITIEAYDPVADAVSIIPISAENWATFLTFEVIDNNLIRTANRPAIESFLETYSSQLPGKYLGIERADAISNAIETNQPFITMQMQHEPQIHTVVNGDTLAGIGNQYGIPYPWIQSINPNSDSLTIGQQITIPSVDEMLPLPVIRNKRVIISISQQYMWVYENGAVRWEWPVSTGIAESPTSPGIFQVQSHELEAYGGAWDLFMPNFMGVYLPAPGLELMNGFHGFPTRDGTNLLWTNSLGSPATYGCILIDNNNIIPFYDWAEKGVVVEIQR